MAAAPTRIDPAPLTPPHTPQRTLTELAVGYALILLVIWTPRPFQRPLYLVAAIFLATVTWTSFSTWSAMGLRLTNLLRSLWVTAAALVVAAVVVLLAIRLRTLHAPLGARLFVQRFWGYALWASVQQILLQDFFLNRLRRLLPSRPVLAALAAAAIFSLAHLPNPILTPVTFLWGFIACLVFLHYRNLIPLSLAHAILGITLAISIPGPLMRNMRVGLGYLTYPHSHHPGTHPPGTHPHRSQADHIVSTQACVIADDPTRLRSRQARP